MNDPFSLERQVWDLDLALNTRSPFVLTAAVLRNNNRLDTRSIEKWIDDTMKAHGKK